MQFLTSILNAIRCCPTCGTSLEIQPWLCLSCQAEMMNRLKPQVRMIEGGIKHCYLFPWISGDQFTSRMVYSLKGGGLESTFQFFINQMYLNFSMPFTQQLFYPSTGSDDHAFALAQALQIRGKFTIEPLIKVGPGKQALLGWSRRRNIEFLARQMKGRRAFIIDDIVTTGSTVLACHRALGGPGETTVWSLFYRKSL